MILDLDPHKSKGYIIAGREAKKLYTNEGNVNTSSNSILNGA